jgi:PBSX family phage terminase large subunit
MIDRWLLFITSKNAPTKPFAIIGKTLDTINRNILSILDERLGKQHFNYSLGLREATIFGKRHFLIGVNDDRAASKIRGLTLGGILGDEVSTWPKESFDTAISRMSVEGAKFFGTTNPESPYHWLKTEYLDNTSLDIFQMGFQLDDNPFLPDKYRTDLSNAYKGSKLLYDRYIRGLWVAGEGAIYDMFNEEINRKECNLIDNLDLKIGLDYGTTNPLAAVATIEQNDVTYVISELYYDSRKVGIQKTDSEYVELIKQWISKFKTKQITFVIDPSATSFITAMKRANFHVINANNSVREGITLVSEKFLNKTLFISKECPILIANIKNYSWDDKAIIRGVEQPIKRDDHLPDALRYAVNTEKVIFSFTPIERIRGY